MLETVLLWAIVLLLLVVLVPAGLALFQRIRAGELDRVAGVRSAAPPPPQAAAKIPPLQAAAAAAAPAPEPPSRAGAAESLRLGRHSHERKAAP